MRIPWVISGVARSQGDLQRAMDLVTAENVGQMLSYDIPPLALSGVVYERERRRHPMPGVERFQTATDVYAVGHGDCDGLAPYRAAELIVRGHPARAKVIRSPGVGYHVLVVRPRIGVGGFVELDVEDPSADLGMLDGVGQYHDDALVSADARRRARGTSFLKRAMSLARKGGAGVTAPQRAALAQSYALASHADALLSRGRGVRELPEPRDDDDGDVSGVDTLMMRAAFARGR